MRWSLLQLLIFSVATSVVISFAILFGIAVACKLALLGTLSWWSTRLAIKNWHRMRPTSRVCLSAAAVGSVALLIGFVVFNAATFNQQERQARQMSIELSMTPRLSDTHVEYIGAKGGFFIVCGAVRTKRDLSVLQEKIEARLGPDTPGYRIGWRVEVTEPGLFFDGISFQPA